MKDAIQQFSNRVGYTDLEMEMFSQENTRVRHVNRLYRSASLYSIQVEIVSARHCNSGYQKGDKFILDINGNLISKHCPKRLCVYLVSQFIIPVALINERLSEEHKPNDFHFMRNVKCLDTGVECLGYGEVMASVKAVERKQKQ